MEDPRVYFYLLDARAVQCFEGANDSGFLAGAGGPVDEEVGEVAALGLGRRISSVSLRGEGRGKGRQMKDGAYEGAESFGEIFVVGQLVEGLRTVFVYYQCHGVLRVSVEDGGL